MTNYENQKERIDAILNSNNDIAIDIDTNEITTCRGLACSRCLFFGEYNENTSCCRNTIKWLVSEYKEPEVDWSKVAIDTPVLVSNDGEEWERRYFSRVNCYGTVFVFIRGATSWSSDGHEAWHQYVKLAEGRE